MSNKLTCWRKETFCKEIVIRGTYDRENAKEQFRCNLRVCVLFSRRLHKKVATKRVRCTLNQRKHCCISAILNATTLANAKRDSARNPRSAASDYVSPVLVKLKYERKRMKNKAFVGPKADNKKSMPSGFHICSYRWNSASIALHANRIAQLHFCAICHVSILMLIIVKYIVRKYEREYMKYLKNFR